MLDSAQHPQLTKMQSVQDGVELERAILQSHNDTQPAHRP